MADLKTIVLDGETLSLVDSTARTAAASAEQAASAAQAAANTAKTTADSVASDVALIKGTDRLLGTYDDGTATLTLTTTKI